MAPFKNNATPVHTLWLSSAPFTSMGLSSNSRRDPWTGVLLFLEESSIVFQYCTTPLNRCVQVAALVMAYAVISITIHVDYEVSK